MLKYNVVIPKQILPLPDHDCLHGQKCIVFAGRKVTRVVAPQGLLAVLTPHRGCVCVPVEAGAEAERETMIEF